MKVAYYRVFHNDPHAEIVTGAPTLLIDSEPTIVVKKTSTGKLVMYFHYACSGLWMNRERIE